ncbi:MAG TPA: tetratricopeptide repeat protein [Anaerolineales bacterium]|nr:tetratricopeptide repeat protein [Anaerolineales bacterium]
MAKVSLRAYNREIEAMIDRGHLDEAVAHCQHILKTFPKHLETYRLLGKSYLEAKRHDEAVDIFSRVLVAEPSDFVAQVGMSIIRDEQDKLDDAIWHMERAFESQPSNAAIQGELQRLYGRRDGAQPPRIRMTRGALAHMYMQGELYPQTISEAKGVLKEDSGRIDMQTLLAKAYFKSGQKNDAADVASAVLKRYLYCLDANRVLTEILGSDRPESAEGYRRRVYELDPYAAQVDNVFRSDDASDAAVSLEQLDWNGQPVGMSSNWGTTDGISLKEGEQPDWLKQTAPHEEGAVPPYVPAFVSEDEETSVPDAESPAQPAEEIPDFLRAAGWGESSGAFDESKSSAMFDDQPVAEAQPIEQGDMPDWVKAMAPEETQSPDAPDEEEIPDWINKIGTGELPVPGVDSTTDDQLDWLSQTGDETPIEITEADAVDQPDLSSQFGSETEAADDADFLNSLKSDEPEEQTVASSEERTTMPDDQGNLGMGEEEQDDSFAWLENLAAKQGATEGLLTDPEERLEEEPDWVKQAKGLDESTSQPPAETPQEEQQLVEESQTEPEPGVSAPEPVDADSLGKSDEERDDSFNWLENLAAKQGATEGLLTKPEDRREEEPDWVKKAKSSAEKAQTPAETSDEPASSSEDEMDWMADAKEVGGKFFDESMGVAEDKVEEAPAAAVEEKPVAPTSSDEDADAWMRTLDESEPTPEPEHTPTETSSGDDDVMAWMEREDTPVPEADAPESEAAEASGDLPGWLSSLDEDEAKPAAVPESDDLPAWMTDDTGELLAEPTKIEPTQSTDWSPAEEPKEAVPAEEVPSPPPATEPEPVAEPEPTPTPKKKPEPEKKEVKLAKPPEPYKEPVTRKTTGMLEKPVDPTLGSARAELSRSNIPGALETYGKLIKKGRFLEEVIFDLRDALYRYPVEVSIWQSLGDAYMRANQLQDALDAYTKAEELLR